MSEFNDQDKHQDIRLQSEMTNNKEKYSDTELNSKLLEYFTDNPGKKITFLGLEKATGISRFVWKRRMAAEIAKLNNRSQDNVNYSGSLEIANVAQTIKRLIGERKHKELDQYLRSVNIAVQNVISKALNYDKLEQKLERITKENEEKDKTIAVLKEAIAVANKTHFSSAIKTRYKVTKTANVDVTDIQRKAKENAAVAFLTKEGLLGIFDDDN